MEGNHHLDGSNGEMEDATTLDKMLDRCHSIAHRTSTSSASAAGGGSGDGNYRLFNCQQSIHQMIGGGRAADVILWKCRWGSIGVIVVSTAAWLLFELSGLSFLTICSDILLILIVTRFLWANSTGFLNKKPQPLPELVLSEEMVNNVAASFRVKFNNMLMMAHDITLGNDFRFFIQVVIIFWLLSVVGSFFSFFTLVYIGILVSITVPALYNQFEDHVDRYAGLVHRNISKHYKIVDENVMHRLPKGFSKIEKTKEK